MSFVPYAGNPGEWEQQRGLILAGHNLDNAIVHSNLEPAFCNCLQVLSAPLQNSSFDGRVCAHCGGSSFLTTGTCHTCATCATSDGCG